MKKEKLKTVPDTNIIIAACKNPKEHSYNKEYINLWLEDKYNLLYSDDTYYEYIEKFTDLNIPESTIKKFLSVVEELGVYIYIDTFHLSVYPKDPDDIAFVLCAENGNATHLISNDRDLLEIKYKYSFKICRIIEFIKDFRKTFH